MIERCCFDFDVPPEVVDYTYDDFKEHLIVKCAPGLFEAVSRAKAQIGVIDPAAARDATVDVDLKCKIRDDFVPDCKGSITIKTN